MGRGLGDGGVCGMEGWLHLGGFSDVVVRVWEGVHFVEGSWEMMGRGWRGERV